MTVAGQNHGAGASTGEIGTVLAQRYEVVRELGRGGMGVVYLCKDIVTGDRVALKRLRSPEKGETRAEESWWFHQEARAVALLNHAAIVRARDFGQLADGSPFFVMDVLPGRSVHEWMHTMHLPWSVVWAMVDQVLAALAHAHARGVIHGDLKPSNIMLDLATTTLGPRAFVLDLGLAWLREYRHDSRLDGASAPEVAVHSGAGTVGWVAPEQIRRQASLVGPATGFFLTAYNIDSSGNVDTSATAPVQVSALLDNPVATTNVTYDANLPSNATTGFQATPSTVQIFDALGNTNDLTYTWSKTGVNTWVLDAAAPNASYDTQLTFVFNNGSSGPAGTIESITNSGGDAATVTTPTATGDAADVSVALTFPGGSAQTVSLQFGNYGESTGVTQFSDANTAVSVTNFDQNGLPRGSFNSFTISPAGLVSINYSNGTTRNIAQIPVVQFFAEDQLQRISGGAFEATLASGTARYSLPGATGAGTISSSSLEQSNVDIATQFTDLIQAQQVYSANAKVVTTDNQLLQVTINMVQ